MKLVYLFLIILFTGAPALSQVISFPKDYSIIDSVAGDLDKDGVDELVVAYNTRKGNEGSSESIPRQLVIYKKRNSQWTEWEKSDQVLYGSREGGMMGDPFGEINIEKGILRISQKGGTSWKWVHTVMYRWDSASFRLIGFNSTYGKPCAYWEDVDFNLVT